MKIKHRILSFLLAIFSCTVGFMTAQSSVETTAKAKSQIIIDADSGQIVFEENADEQFNIAGAQKIMSQLIFMQAVESGALGLDDEITISKDAAKAGGMSVFLATNEVYSVRELLKASFVVSANDATIALAEKISGSTEAFLDNMNAKAQELSISPVFVNVTGHNADGQKMSAREAATIAQKLVTYPQALEWGKLYLDEMSHPGGRKTELANPNKMVRFYEGCDGLGTGSNNAEGYSGIFTAQKDGKRFIAVVIGAKNSDERSNIAKSLLDDAFNNYITLKVIDEGKGVAKDIPVEGGIKKTVHGVAENSANVLIKKGEESLISKEPVLYAPQLTAPVEKGAVVGELIIKKAGEPIAKVNIVSYEDNPVASFSESFRKIMLDYLHV